MVRARQNRRRQQTALAVETVHKGAEEHTSWNYMMSGSLAPVGRVHLVKLGDIGDEREQHFMVQMDADSNMGAKKLARQSRRGPFKNSSGRSRVLDRSAHVHYRQRGAGLEITIHRGVTDYEMATLIGKLGAHRVATHGSILFFIKGNSKKKIGLLDQVSLQKVREKIEECLEKYRVAGLLLQDTKRKGAMHKAYSHGMQMKENYRTADFGSN